VNANVRERPFRRGMARSAAVIGVVLMGLAVASAVGASGARVTRGEVHAFATGVGNDITGDARMVRTADGQTIVIVHVEGLAPDTAYGSHVHQQACANGEADGHYKFDPAGPATPPNEIWPAFTTNAAGIGNGHASVDGTAGPTAMSVVVHAPGGAKIACADLD
jgi:hypothetical protein